MSFVVVLLVAAGVWLVVRMSRKARIGWLSRLDLVGVWHWEQGDGTLRFATDRRLDRGTLWWRIEQQEIKGDWVLVGHTLAITFADGRPDQHYELRFFAPGRIGLSGDNGLRHLYTKESDNVVPLRPEPGSDSSPDPD